MAGWLLGHKQWAGNRNAFEAASASGNSMKVTDLEAGAKGRSGKPQAALASKPQRQKNRLVVKETGEE